MEQARRHARRKSLAHALKIWSRIYLHRSWSCHADRLSNELSRKLLQTRFFGQWQACRDWKPIIWRRIQLPVIFWAGFRVRGVFTSWRESVKQSKHVKSMKRRVEEYRRQILTRIGMAWTLSAMSRAWTARVAWVALNGDIVGDRAIQLALKYGMRWKMRVFGDRALKGKQLLSLLICIVAPIDWTAVPIAESKTIPLTSSSEPGVDSLSKSDVSKLLEPLPDILHARTLQPFSPRARAEVRRSPRPANFLLPTQSASVSGLRERIRDEPLASRERQNEAGAVSLSSKRNEENAPAAAVLPFTAPRLKNGGDALRTPLGQLKQSIPSPLKRSAFSTAYSPVMGKGLWQGSPNPVGMIDTVDDLSHEAEVKMIENRLGELARQRRAYQDDLLQLERVERELGEHVLGDESGKVERLCDQEKKLMAAICSWEAGQTSRAAEVGRLRARIRDILDKSEN